MAGTLLSTYFNLGAKYKIKLVGQIPVGLPSPIIPRISLLSTVAIDGFVIAVVAYIISVSMALIFAKKQSYEINTNQELLAQGLGNLVGSFFSCLPFAASLSRSAIQEAVGGVTQLASLVSCSILCVVLISIGPFFEPLPRCILACLIIVALKSILAQVLDIFQIWHVSKLDGIIWISTFLTVVFVEIDIGLLVGIFISVCVVLCQGMKTYTCALEHLPNTELYVDTSRYSKTEDIPGIRIIHYSGGLNFANRSYFRNKIHKLVYNNSKNMNFNMNNEGTPRKCNVAIKFVIVDLTATHYIDSSGASAVQVIVEEFLKDSITVLFAGASGPVYDSLCTLSLFKENEFTCFPSIHDAVLLAQNQVGTHVYSIRL